MEELEIENINDTRRAKGLQEIEYDKIEWDYDGYCLEVSRMCTSFIIKDLQVLGVIRSGVFQELKSPREYNFYNDSINVKFTLTPANVAKIKDYLKEHEEAFTKYLEDRYTSYDGFISRHSNNLEDWTVDIMETLTHKHRVGAVLQFILLNEEGADYELNQVYDYVQGNGGYLTAANYEALTGAEAK